MGGKAERRPTAVDHAPVALQRLRFEDDGVRRGRSDILDMEFIEVHELDRNPAEIVPHPGEDFFDLGVGFFRKGGA